MKKNVAVFVDAIINTIPSTLLLRKNGNEHWTEYFSKTAECENTFSLAIEILEENLPVDGISRSYLDGAYFGKPEWELFGYQLWTQREIDQIAKNEQQMYEFKWVSNEELKKIKTTKPWD